MIYLIPSVFEYAIHIYIYIYMFVRESQLVDQPTLLISHLIFGISGQLYRRPCKLEPPCVTPRGRGLLRPRHKSDAKSVKLVVDLLVVDKIVCS